MHHVYGIDLRAQSNEKFLTPVFSLNRLSFSQKTCLNAISKFELFALKVSKNLLPGVNDREESKIQP